MFVSFFHFCSSAFLRINVFNKLNNSVHGGSETLTTLAECCLFLSRLPRAARLFCSRRRSSRLTTVPALQFTSLYINTDNNIAVYASCEAKLSVKLRRVELLIKLHLRATECHLPFGITQCLPSTRHKQWRF